MLLYINMTLRPQILGDIKQIHRAILTGLWNIGHIIPNYDSHTSNCLQDVT